MSETGWKPEYPDQTEPEWQWWDREYSEHGLSGFHTVDDRDRFSAGKPGPFRRRVVKGNMREISQIEDWSMMLKRMSREAGIA